MRLGWYISGAGHVALILAVLFGGKEELIKKFVSVEFNRFLDYYKNAGDLNATPSKSRGGEREKSC